MNTGLIIPDEIRMRFEHHGAWMRKIVDREMTVESATNVMDAIDALKDLSEKERLIALNSFCSHCSAFVGSKSCQCSNDE
jgi:hypothetical protein